MGAWIATYGTPIAGGGAQSSTAPTGRYWSQNGVSSGGDQSSLMTLPVNRQAYTGNQQHPAFQGGPVPAPVPAAPPMPQVNQLGLPAQAPGFGAQQPGFLGLPQQQPGVGQVMQPGFGQGFGHWLGLLQSGQLGQLPPGLAQKPMFQPNQQTNLVGGM